jgi:hypothetical protein
VTLVAEFRAAVQSFEQGQTTLEDVEDWLAAHVQALADDPDEQARDLANEAWFLLDDYSRRLLSIDDLRHELSQLASTPRVDSIPARG